VNKVTYNVCPSVYKFRIQPFETVLQGTCADLNRVFEVEEHMGSAFIQEVAIMHLENKKTLEKAFGVQIHQSQKSLPSYLQGKKLAEVCKQLEQIKCHSGPCPLKGAGKIIYDSNFSYLRGEMVKITENSYYRYDRDRYLQCLENFRKGWDYYLSVLEI
jgi:hypothetical protein